MKNVGRSFAAALLLFAMTAVTLADGQIGIPLTSSTATQTNTTYQGQVYTSPATSSTTGVAGQMYTTATGLMLFQTFSSVL